MGFGRPDCEPLWTLGLVEHVDGHEGRGRLGTSAPAILLRVALLLRLFLQLRICLVAVIAVEDIRLPLTIVVGLFY